MKMLYNHFYSKLMLFVSYFIKSKHDAEEIVSDTFYTIWEQRLKLANLECIASSYIYTIAKNTTLLFLKRQRKEKYDMETDVAASDFPAQPDNSPEDELIGKELMEKLHAAIENLPEKSRMAFKLVREQGLKYKEAAEIMEISVKTLEAHMALATKRLLKTLDEN
jgi:RNA polymerase sigma-70 factor (ECF subfamily)